MQGKDDDWRAVGRSPLLVCTDYVGSGTFTLQLRTPAIQVGVYHVQKRLIQSWRGAWMLRRNLIHLFARFAMVHRRRGRDQTRPRVRENQLRGVER
ncbi:hypothetical protein SUGI_1042500 [Cryptomeria japonica]|nr:hypothetical protein SUGI_1042500 [Cryptomeria japonica]